MGACMGAGLRAPQFTRMAELMRATEQARNFRVFLPPDQVLRVHLWRFHRRKEDTCWHQNFPAAAFGGKSDPDKLDFGVGVGACVLTSTVRRLVLSSGNR